ncbi:hypothetical protein PHMEG_00010171 [Phytophthora megakarya]|uniref:Uncharacterized protein n=1 Tax=Phytophthora megakarya TaxID=4795 RepID=A0A225WFQ0_9STRA|nr:hypothetical protein PHMEG_00010171 [Phytophthora megakarya]
MAAEAVDASQVKMGMGTKAGGCCTKSVIFSSLAFIFVILNLAALWALHFADRPTNKAGLRSATRFSTGLAATDGNTLQEGDVVSYNSENVLRAGAGTTAYLNKLTLDETVTNIPYVYFAPMGTSSASFTNIMSYTKTSGTTIKSYISTISFTADNNSLVAGTVDETNNVVTDKVRGLATLSDTQMVALVVSSSYKVSVIPATINGADNTVTLSQSMTKDVATGSATNFVATLSSSNFVVAFYEAYSSTPYYQDVKVGTVDSSGVITLSSATAFGPANNVNFNTQFGAPVALKGLSATEKGFVIPYYTTLGYSTTKTDADLSGLCVTSATYGSTVSAFSTAVCDTTYRPGHYPEAVALSDNAMAIIFYDTANNNALTIAIVTVSSDKSLRFRSSYVVPGAYGSFADYDPYAFVTPHISVLSGNRVAVSFHNPMLDGKLSVRVLSFSLSTLSFAELTPTLPVAPSTFSWALSDPTDSTLSGALTSAMLPMGADGVVAAYVGKRNNVVNQNFAVVQSFGKPIGIVQSISSKEASITTQGKAEASGLTAGMVYYATTSGEVVAPGNSTDSEFFYTEDGSMMVTMDSRVGVATDDDTLFVSTTF